MGGSLYLNSGDFVSFVFHHQVIRQVVTEGLQDVQPSSQSFGCKEGFIGGSCLFGVVGHYS